MMEKVAESEKLSEMIYPELLTTQKLSFFSPLTSKMTWRLKLDFVLRDYQLDPAPEDPSWLQAEQRAKYLISQRADRTIYPPSNDKPFTSKSFMDHVEKLYKGEVHVNLSLTKYSRCRMEHDGDVNEHMFRMRALAKLVGFCGMEIPENVQGLMLLRSLPEDWEEDVERVMILFHASKEDLSFENVGTRLRAANEFREWRKYQNLEKEGWSEDGSSEKGKGKTSASSGDETSSFSYGLVNSTEEIYSDLKTRFQLDYTGSDFRNWKSRIHTVLMDKEVYYLLKDDSPSEEAASSEHTRLSNEFIARHIILGGMSDDLFLTFHDYPTARALMDALETWFDSPSIANQMVQFSKYTRCQMSENAPVDQHLSDMDLMVRNLEEIGVEVPDEMQAQLMIDSLPGSWYDIQKELILDLDETDDDNEDFKLVDRVRHHVRVLADCREMKQREDSESRKRKRVKGNCYSCGRPGHYRYNCPNDV